MKLIPILTLLVCIQLGFLIFDSQACVGTSCSNLIADNSTMGSQTVSSTTPGADYMWSVIFDPSNFGGSTFLTLLVGLITVSGAVAVGLYFVYKSDLIILFPLFTAMLGFGAIPIVNLYNLIHRESAMFGCSAADVSCFPPKILTIFVGLLAIWWLWACISFWTGRETG